MTWVGFELLHHPYQVGISKRRADCIVRWSREVASTTRVNMSNCEKDWGQKMYVLGALEFERPFLGPLYRYLTLHLGGSIRRVPECISFNSGGIFPTRWSGGGSVHAQSPSYPRRAHRGWTRRRASAAVVSGDGSPCLTKTVCRIQLARHGFVSRSLLICHPGSTKKERSPHTHNLGTGGARSTRGAHGFLRREQPSAEDQGDSHAHVDRHQKQWGRAEQVNVDEVPEQRGPHGVGKLHDGAVSEGPRR